MYAPNELETYRIAMDPNLSAADKQAQIDSLFANDSGLSVGSQPETLMMQAPTSPTPQSPTENVAALSPPPMPDTRLASNVGANEDFDFLQKHGLAGDPTAPPGPPPSAADVGPNMRVAPSASGPQAPTQEQLDTAKQQAADSDMQAILKSGFQSPRGAIIPAHEQPVSEMVSAKAPVPEETKEELKASQEAEAGLALKAGDVEAENAGKRERAAAENATQAYFDQEDFKQRMAHQEEEFRKASDDYQTLVKESAIEPNAFWTSKNTGQQIVSVLGAMMMGLGGRPEMMRDIIKDDMASRVGERDKQLSGFRQKLEDIKGRMVNPEAAQQMEYAMANRAAAAEAERLAASTQSPEAKMIAEQTAQHLLTEAAQAEANASAGEYETRRQIAYVPARAVAAPSLLDRAHEVSKKTGMPLEEVVQRMNGTYGGKVTAEDTKSMVLVPGGGVYYTPNRPEEAQKATEQLKAANGLKDSYARLQQLMREGGTGRTLDRANVARIQANIAANLSTLRASMEGGGGGMRMSPEMLDRLNPLTGANADDPKTFTSTVNAGLQEASRLLNAQEETLKSTLLTRPPSTLERGAPVKTGGASQASVGFKKEE